MTKPVEVSLAQFAAVCGLTEREFLDNLFYLIHHSVFLSSYGLYIISDFFNIGWLVSFWRTLFWGVIGI